MTGAIDLPDHTHPIRCCSILQRSHGKCAVGKTASCDLRHVPGRGGTVMAFALLNSAGAAIFNFQEVCEK
jgi:hypothetical protein